MKNKKSKQELTRLILTALILGGGCLYGPVAEATDPKVVDENMTTINASNNTYKMTCDTSNKYVTGNGNPMYVPIIINGVNNGTNGLTAYSFYGEYAHSTSASGFGNITLNGGTLNNFAGCYNGVNGAFYNKAYIHHNVGTGTVYNNVTVNGDVYGGHSSGNVTNNTVEINQQTGKTVTVNGNVYGGKSTAANAGMGQGTGNSVTINGGNIVGSIYGGYSDSKDAFNNSVTLGGTTTKKITIGGNVVGGRAGHGKVTDSNSVILQGTAQVAGYMYGGARRSDSGSDDIPINIISGYNDGNVLYLDGSAQGNIVTGTVAGFTNFVIKNNFTFKPNTTSASAILKAGTMNVNFLDFYNNASTLRNDKDSAGTMTLLLSDTNMGGNFYIYPYASKSEIVTLQAGIAGKDTYNVTSFSGEKYYTNPSDHNNSLVLTHSGTHVIKYPDQKHLNYVITNNLTAVDLSKWDGTTATVPTGWTKGTSDVSVSGTVPSAAVSDVTAGNSKDILTTTTSDLFTGATGLPQSTTAFSENLATGVDITGNKVTGVQVTDSGKKLTYYNAVEDKDNMTGVTFGAMTWGQAAASASGYKFTNTASINDSNLSFTFTDAQKVALNQDSSMTLLTGATNLAASTGASREQNITSSTTNGAALSGTLKGKVSSASGTVTYNVDSMTLNTIGLNDWDGSAGTTGTAVGNLPSGWTAKTGGVTVDTGNFSVTPDTNIDIFTTNTAGFFGTVTGTHTYTAQGDPFTTVDKGVTISGNKAGGVKATDSGKKLTYFAEAFDGHTITLGGMAWGTPREAGTSYNFSNLTSIDATNLSFTNPLAVGSVSTSTALLTNATDLVPNFSPITYASGATSHTQNFTDAVVDNGVKLNGTINGTVSTTAGEVDYTLTGKSITGANLANWDSTKSAFSLAGWTNGFTNGSINAAGFTAPDVKAGQSKDILTASNGFFNNDYITGAQKYGPSGTPSSDTEANVTFTGSQEKGVKASTDGTKLQYVAGNMAVSDINLGNMEVGAGGTVTKRTADGNYSFDGSTTINATNLTFDKPADVVDSTLVSGATGITSSNPVTGASHSQAINNAAVGTGGITVSGTLNGTVAAVDGGVNYTVNNKTVSSMDLSGWDTNIEGTTLPTTDDKWTGSNVAVSTGTFTAPTTDKTIFTTNIGGFFGDVTGAMAYKSGAAFSGDVDAGVTLSGTKSGGVKKSDDGKNLNFIAELKTVNNIALGTMNWGTSRTITGNYDFSDVVSSGIDASKLSFTGFDVNTIKATDTMILLTGAKGLGAGLVAPVSPSQSLSYNAANGATLSGTLKGTVSTEAVDAQTSKVTYTVDSKTLDSVNLSNWNGNNTDLDASWSKNANGINVSGSGFTAPTTIGDTPILTTNVAGYFSNAQIANNIKYQPSGSYTETDKNITLSGSRGSGVKADDNDGSKLVYSIGAAFINNIKLGTVTYDTTGPWIDKSNINAYNFSNLSSLDTTGFFMSMTDDQKKSAALNDTMTLVKGTSDLPDIAAKDAGSSNYTYAATNGLTVGGTVSGSVSASNHDVLYKVTGNKATTLNITNVTWDEGNAYYNRDNAELDYKDAVVDSSNIFFSGITSLNKDKIMTLISNYGSGINKTRSGIFTIDDGNGNLLKGKGVAYYDSGSNSLMYKVTLGAGEIQPAVSATNNKAILIIPDGQEHQGTVTGGEAKGEGDSTGNEQGVKGTVVTNDDGTGGDVNGGTSEEGDSRRNKADVEDSTIEGDVNGGKSENGNSTDNEAEVDHSNVGGDVNGGKTDGDGETKGNEANVKNGSKVTGSVTGGRSGGNGDCTGNAAEVEGSEVGGDVNGGQSDGNGNTRENKTHVKDSKVTGNVIGGHSGQNDGSGGNGESTGNTAEVEGSEVGGNVNGGRSEQGNANKNESTVSGGSKVTGDVTGGSSGGGGTANENKTTVEGGSHIGGNVTGGESNGGNTNKNETTVSGSTVDKDVIGGKTSGNGTSNENKTNVNGSKVGGNVIGGQSENGNAEKNETTISGGSTVGGNVIGGKTTGTGNANENKVTLDGGSTVNGNIYGGYSQNGDASGNDVNIGTGKINGDIYGGFGSGNTTNNTITLSSGADVSNSNIFGGSNGSAGNTLNIGTSTEAWSGGGQSVKNISNFETLNFSSVPWNNSNAALNISDGSASDLSMTTIQAPQVAFSGVKRLSSGSTMMFLNQSNVNPATKRATNLVAGSAFTLGTAMEGSGRLTLDADGNVVYLVENASVSEQTHNTVMAAEAAVLSINSGNDFINSATEGLAQKENVGTDGLATYAKIGGQSMKQDTGSHVKVNTWNAILALGHKNTKKQSAFEYGAFVEHGWGNFATHNNGLRGDGSAEYTGGGLLAKWKTNNGTYVEGSFRAGTVNEKANNLLRDAVQAYGYDERTSYAGFHIGVGKETVLKNGNLVDVYGKYFYNRKNGMNFNAGFDEYNIDAVTSQILRVGARYTVKSGSRWNYYGDLSYEHEFDGKATGRVNDMAIRGADISGGSLRMELGASLTPNDESPWEVDFNLTAYAGNKSGFTGGISVKYAF